MLVDLASGRTLVAENADKRIQPASLTKLMTAAVVLDAHQPMDQPIEITDDDIDTLKWSSSRLRPGMVFTREELLKLALMSSENRAAHAPRVRRGPGARRWLRASATEFVLDAFPATPGASCFLCCPATAPRRLDDLASRS